MSNELLVIHPYKHSGVWVFDDPAVGLEREPFVAGMPEIIEHVTREIPNAERGFTAIFSPRQFPGATERLEFVRSEMDGSTYRHIETGMEGWLCPALFRYFDEAPPELWVEVKAAAVPSVHEGAGS